MEQLSRVQRTILEQIKEQNPLFKADYGVKQVLKDGEDTVRLHTKNNGHVINIDIELTVRDTYTVRLHKLTGRFNTGVETEEHKNVYFDQLNRLIQKELDNLLH